MLEKYKKPGKKSMKDLITYLLSLEKTIQQLIIWLFAR
jgi:hypothetical protein